MQRALPQLRGSLLDSFLRQGQRHHSFPVNRIAQSTYGERVVGECCDQAVVDLKLETM